jgi:transposase-like protein
VHDGFEGMTYPREIIVKTIHLYVEGLSWSKVREYIHQHEGYYLYDGTILYWVRKYSHLFSAFEEKLTPSVKGKVHTDETYVKVKGKKHYSINSIDDETKYNLATTLTPRRTERKCKERCHPLLAINGKASPSRGRKRLRRFKL